MSTNGGLQSNGADRQNQHQGNDGCEEHPFASETPIKPIGKVAADLALANFDVKQYLTPLLLMIEGLACILAHPDNQQRQTKGGLSPHRKTRELAKPRAK